MSGMVLILDAMGVMFQAGDDVVELLIPFLAEHGGTRDAQRIDQLYHQASLGVISADMVWEGAGVSPAREDKYLARHKLADGLIDFFSNRPKVVEAVWCLSNDVATWSLKLREQFGLTRYLAGAVISGDVKCRKPDARIYEILLERIGRSASECVFVDDRPKNLQTAKRLGMHTVLFGELVPTHAEGDHASVKTFAELAAHLATFKVD